MQSHDDDDDDIHFVFVFGVLIIFSSLPLPLPPLSPVSNPLTSLPSFSLPPTSPSFLSLTFSLSPLPLQKEGGEHSSSSTDQVFFEPPPPIEWYLTRSRDEFHILNVSKNKQKIIHLFCKNPLAPPTRIRSSADSDIIGSF